MAQAYHIYLHSDSSNVNGGGNQTQPFSVKKEESFSSSLNQIKNAANSNIINTGAATLSKASPILAAVVAAAKITDRVLTVGFAHQEEYTGYYKNNMMWNNFKAHINIAVNPIRYILNIAHQNFQFDKKNKEIEQQNRLIGNSILKDFNIGV